MSLEKRDAQIEGNIPINSRTRGFWCLVGRTIARLLYTGGWLSPPLATTTTRSNRHCTKTRTHGTASLRGERERQRQLRRGKKNMPFFFLSRAYIFKPSPGTRGKEKIISSVYSVRIDVDNATGANKRKLRLSMHACAPRALSTSSFVRFTRNSFMILPQVHLRKPCYDFYFL